MIELLREIELKRGVPVEQLCSALEEALGDAFRQHVGTTAADVIATVDREDGAIGLVRRRLVVDEVADPVRELVRADAPDGYEPGDFFDEPLELGKFGRVAALTARHTIEQRVIESEREAVYAKYRALQGTIVRGLVQRVVDGSVFVALEYDVEAELPPEEQCPGDAFAINDTLEAELLGVYKAPRGPVLVLSRSRASYVHALFGRPEILASARRAGYVTVLATSRPLPPLLIADVRVKIGGERLEVLRWSHDPAELVVQLMPVGTGEVFAIAEHRLIIVEGANVTPLQLELARQLCPGWGVRIAEPGKSDVALEEHLAAIAPAADDEEIDPELVRKLEEFARERDEADGA